MWSRVYALFPDHIQRKLHVLGEWLDPAVCPKDGTAKCWDANEQPVRSCFWAPTAATTLLPIRSHLWLWLWLLLLRWRWWWFRLAVCIRDKPFIFHYDELVGDRRQHSRVSLFQRTDQFQSSFFPPKISLILPGNVFLRTCFQVDLYVKSNRDCTAAQGTSCTKKEPCTPCDLTAVEVEITLHR